VPNSSPQFTLADISPRESRQ